MTRNLKAIGLAVMAMLALGAFFASAAQAEKELPGAVFTFGEIGGGEKAVVKGEQIGTNEFQIGGLPPVTCATVTLAGEAETAGTSSQKVKLTPAFTTCHITILGATKAATLTMNSCFFRLTATTTETTNTIKHFTAHTDIACSNANDVVEIHVYNTNAAPHEPTLCTFHVVPQTGKTHIYLTNNLVSPKDHITANLTVKNINVVKTFGGIACGADNQTAELRGQWTLQGFKAGPVQVNLTVSN